MARDYLAITGKKKFIIIILIESFTLINKLFLITNKATSVPVERAFSGGADLIAAKRCSLNANTISACMCLKSWWAKV